MNVPGPAITLNPYQTLLYRKPLHPELFALKARRHIQHNAWELEAWIIPGGHVLRFKHAGFACTELVTDQEGRLPVDGAVTSITCSGEHEFEHRFSAERVGYITSIQTETLSENLYGATYDEMVQFIKETGALSHGWTDFPAPVVTNGALAALNGYATTLNGASVYLNGSANGCANGNGHAHAADHASGNGHLNGNGHANGKPHASADGHAASSGHAKLNGHAPAPLGVRRADPGMKGHNLSILDIQRLHKEVHIQSYHLIGRAGLVLRTQTIFEHS